METYDMPPEWAIGESIPFDSMRELESSGLEDSIARHVLGSTYTDAKWNGWETRFPLTEVLRPQKFNGRLLDIAVTPVEDPVTAITVSGRTLINIAGKASTAGILGDTDADEQYDRIVGFEFSAVAKSTGRDGIPVHANVIYAPIPDYSSLGNYPHGLRRFSERIGQPRAVAESTRVAKQQERVMMQRAIVTPVSQ